MASQALAEAPLVEEELEPESEEIAALPCRPTIACMAEVVPAGTFEVEAGYGGRVASTGVSHSGQLLLKYSLLDRLQLQLATNNVFLVGDGLAARAFDGVMPGVKVLVNEQGTWAPSNAFSLHMMFPTQSFDRAAQTTIDLQGWWYLSRDFGPVHADLNVAGTLYDLGGRRTPQGLTALAISLSLGRGFGVFTEVYSTWGNAMAIPLDGGSLNGISFAPVDSLVIDVGGDVGFYWGTRTFTAFAGVTFVPGAKALKSVARGVGASRAPLASAN